MILGEGDNIEKKRGGREKSYGIEVGREKRYNRNKGEEMWNRNEEGKDEGRTGNSEKRRIYSFRS